MTGDQLIDLYIKNARDIVPKLLTNRYAARSIGEALGVVEVAYSYLGADSSKYDAARTELIAMFDALGKTKESA